jgi:hypothetical protein
MNGSLHLSRSLGCVGVMLACSAAAQDPTGSITGRVLSEEGRALHAIVTLSSSGPRGYPAPPRRAIAGANGTFSFSHLPAGRYLLCAQVSASEPATADSPYLDTCVWGSGQAPLMVGEGQQLAGVVFLHQKALC